MKIAIHPTATKKEIAADFSKLKKFVEDSWEQRTVGDRPGCWHVSIPTEWVRGDIHTLKPGEEIVGRLRFEPRKGVDEDPRQSVKWHIEPDPVMAADVIIFSAEALGKDRSSSEEYEIIAIRALGAVPNPPPFMTEAANAFGVSGGSPMMKVVDGVKVPLTAEEKLARLEKSFLFWRDKVLVG